MAKIALGLIVLGLLGTVAPGQQEIDERRIVETDVELSIENVSGDVTVRGWDEPAVHVTGTLGRGAERLEIDGDEDDLSIRVVTPKGRNRRVGPTTLEVRAPHGCELRVKAVSSDITVREIAGDQELRTVSGDILVRDAEGSLELETVSGDVEIEGNARDIEAKTVSGDITAERFQNSAEFEAVSGDIYVKGENIEKLEASLLSGDVEFIGSLRKSGEIEIECHSGNVNITIPADIQAEFNCETFSGDIKNAFGVEAERKSKHGPGRTLRYVQGEHDDAEITLKTFSGNINIKN
jgi:DUF4097 and DUF4098 domain-containing protein YvlB